MRASAMMVLVPVWVACETSMPVAEGPDAGAEAATPDAAPEDPEVSDAAAPDPGACIERNGPDEIAARDGFVEVCADAVSHPRARCGDGSPYRFSVRPAIGPSRGLLLYFKGGGNCTDYVSCWGRDGMGGEGRRVARMENDETSPPVVATLGRTMGLFDRVDPDALFADHDIVYVSYCTGDGGLGSTDEVLVRPDPPLADADAPLERLTYFRGRDNVSAAIDFARTRFPSPERLTIYGSSAGAYAATGAIGEIMEAFPDVADVAAVSDGGVGIGRDAFLATARSTMAAFDGLDGRRLVRFAAFSHQSDATQREYAPGSSDERAFRAALRVELEAREAALPASFRFFAPPGSCHTIASTPALYQAFTRASGRWMPVTPAVRPNPVLVIEGTSVVSWLREVTRGSGPFDPSFASRAGDWAAGDPACGLP